MSLSTRYMSAGVSETASSARPFQAGRSEPSGPTTSSKRPGPSGSASVGWLVAAA